MQCKKSSQNLSQKPVEYLLSCLVNDLLLVCLTVQCIRVHLSDFSIIIFLSAWNEHLQTKWQQNPVFVVGKATAKAGDSPPFFPVFFAPIPQYSSSPPTPLCKHDGSSTQKASFKIATRLAELISHLDLHVTCDKVL